MKNILILVGSSNKNLKLANSIAQVITSKGHAPKVMDLVDLNLPLYTPAEAGRGIPGSLTGLVKTVYEAEGMVFVAPEYNKGVPPVLINFISWISVSSGDNWRTCFGGKPAAVGTHSGSGGLHALMSMRMQLSEMGMNVVGRQIHTHFNKKLNTESLEDVVNQLIGMI